MDSKDTIKGYTEIKSYTPRKDATLLDVRGALALLNEAKAHVARLATMDEPPLPEPPVRPEAAEEIIHTLNMVRDGLTSCVFFGRPLATWSNLSMLRGLLAGTTLDVRAIGQPDEHDPALFKLEGYIDGADYCDAETERWVYSIGRRVNLAGGTEPGEIAYEYFAALDGRFYENPDYKCMWLR